MQPRDRRPDPHRFSPTRHRRTPAKGQTAIATLDVGDTDVYIQVRAEAWESFVNEVGIVYRFADGANHGYVWLGADELDPEEGGEPYVRHTEVIAGVPTNTVEYPVEQRDGITFGIHVSGTDATVLIDGVPVIETTAYSGNDTVIGLSALWQRFRPPSYDEIYVWDGLPGEVEGILWTGDVTSVIPSVTLGPDKVAAVSAEGVLARTSNDVVTPPRSVGAIAPFSPGVTAGLLVGNVLASIGLLHPPGTIDEGDVTLGPVGLPRGKALELMRRAEEAELGFLHESNEGQVDFQSRGARAGATPAAWFSDAPGAQFGYRTIEPFDWRREIVNRVEAKVAPMCPREVSAPHFDTLATNAGTPNPVQVVMPDALDGVTVGDLFLVIITSTVGATGTPEQWRDPLGWTSLRSVGNEPYRTQVYAKVVEQADLGATVEFYADSAGDGGSWTARIVPITDWYGAIKGGVAVSEFTAPTSDSDALAGVNEPPALEVPWGPAPSMLVAIRAGFNSTVATTLDGSVAFPSDIDNAPDGYRRLGTARQPSNTAALSTAQVTAMREDCIEVERPSLWPVGGGVFEDFHVTEHAVIAVRGFTGDPPETRGGQLVRVDDTASQLLHGNTIRTHSNPAELFASADDARSYGELVLLKHADDRPIYQLSFPATISAAYRAQAARRRVGNMIHLTADGETGLGTDGDFFIEHIAHRVTNAGKVWVVTWQLSPA